MLTFGVARVGEAPPVSLGKGLRCEKELDNGKCCEGRYWNGSEFDSELFIGIAQFAVHSVTW
jgi:hypothetical protein